MTSRHLFLQYCSLLFFRNVRADVDIWGVVTNYSLPTDQCTSHTDQGMSIFCCTGDCHDNTIIEKPGLCFGFNDPCIDIPGGACCESTSVYTNSLYGVYDPGFGDCWVNHECQWQGRTYNWDCCPCPDGFVSENTGCPNIYATQRCIGCAPGVTAELNPVTSTFVCKDQNYLRRACLMGQAYNKALSDISLLWTRLSTFCPSNDALGITLTLYGVAASAIALAVGGESKGINGTGFGFASAAASAISSLAIGAGIAATGIEATGMLAVYEAVCTGIAAISAVTTTIATPLSISTDCHVAGDVYDDLEDVLLGRDMKKRSYIPNSEHSRHILNKDYKNYADMAQRRSSNPCADYLASIPVNFSAFEHLYGSFNHLSLFGSADTFDANVASSMRNLTSQLNQVEIQINYLWLFGQHLKTIADFLPYCDLVDIDVSSSSGSTTTKEATNSTQSTSSTTNTQSTSSDTGVAATTTQQTSVSISTKALTSITTALSITTDKTFSSHLSPSPGSNTQKKSQTKNTTTNTKPSTTKTIRSRATSSPKITSTQTSTMSRTTNVGTRAPTLKTRATSSAHTTP